MTDTDPTAGPGGEPEFDEAAQRRRGGGVRSRRPRTSPPAVEEDAASRDLDRVRAGNPGTDPEIGDIDASALGGLGIAPGQADPGADDRAARDRPLSQHRLRDQVELRIDIDGAHPMSRVSADYYLGLGLDDHVLRLDARGRADDHDHDVADHDHGHRDVHVCRDDRTARGGSRSRG